jgi:hypothetical protein
MLEGIGIIFKRYDWSFKFSRKNGSEDSRENLRRTSYGKLGAMQEYFIGIKECFSGRT